jgi:hypothetical protein
MRKCDVRTLEAALIYLVDCTLATVTGMALKSRIPAGEYIRQVSMAQTGVDWITDMVVGYQEYHGRHNNVIDLYEGDVDKYALSFMNEKNKKRWGLGENK